MPVKIYYPEVRGPFPLIIFSHDLGGSREGYQYLGRHWASHGYVSVHLTHVGSDTGVLTGSKRPLQAMAKAAHNIHNDLNRPKDVSFVIDRLVGMNKNDLYAKEWFSGGAFQKSLGKDAFFEKK